MNFIQLLQSWKTSIIGFIGGVALYLFTVGANLPSNRNDAFKLGVAVIVAGLGLAAKDGDHGASSAPTKPDK